MTISVQDLVRREVGHCVSYLVSTLAQTYTCHNVANQPALKEIDALADQAFELCAPIEDYEEAARQAGWQRGVLTSSMPNEVVYRGAIGKPSHAISASSWQDACEMDGIEPYQREVYEHWIVSDWLADKLIEHGEKVDKEFAGLCVWARTTTGQAIEMDAVIQRIHAELVK